MDQKSLHIYTNRIETPGTKMILIPFRIWLTSYTANCNTLLCFELNQLTYTFLSIKQTSNLKSAHQIYLEHIKLCLNLLQFDVNWKMEVVYAIHCFISMYVTNLWSIKAISIFNNYELVISNYIHLYITTYMQYTAIAS